MRRTHKNDLNTNGMIIYKYIENYINKKGYSPTLREIVNEVNVSIAVAKYHIDKMIAMGLISADFTSIGNLVSRSIKIVKSKENIEKIKKIEELNKGDK